MTIISQNISIILSIIIFIFLILGILWKEWKKRKIVFQGSSKKLVDELDHYENKFNKSKNRNEIIQIISCDFVPFLLRHPMTKTLIRNWEKIYFQENKKKNHMVERTIDHLTGVFRSLYGDFENIYDYDPELSRMMSEARALVNGKQKEKSSHAFHWRLNWNLEEIIQLCFDKNMFSNQTFEKYAKIENKNGVYKIIEFTIAPRLKETHLMEENLKWIPENEVHVTWQAFKYILNAKETNYTPASTDRLDRWGEICLLNELNPGAKTHNNFPPILVFTEKFLNRGMQSILNKIRNHHSSCTRF